MKTSTVIIACVTSFLAGSIGNYMQNYDEIHRKPCHANFHSTTSPWFADTEQKMLEDTEVRIWFAGTPDETEQSGRDWFMQILEYGESVKEPGERRTELFVNERNGAEFIVPAYCYVGEVDGLGDPILFRG